MVERIGNWSTNDWVGSKRGQACARAELHGRFCFALDVRKLCCVVWSCYFRDRLLYLIILHAWFILHSLLHPSEIDGYNFHLYASQILGAFAELHGTTQLPLDGFS